MRWTAEHDELLRVHYPEGVGAAAAKLGRSRGSVTSRAHRLELTARPRWWSEREDDFLLSKWGRMPLRSIAKQLGRSVAATHWRAGKLGLGCGCPQGYECICRSAKRVGYDVSQLRRVLAAAGVMIRRAESRPYRGTHYTHHYVDPFAVDAAVALWHKSESVESGARRHGVSAPSLRSWLRAARALGLELPPEPTRKSEHWRVLSVVIDDVVMARMAMRLRGFPPGVRRVA